MNQPGGLAPTRKVSISPAHEQALAELDRRRQDAERNGRLKESRSAVLAAHINAAREHGVNYYLATRTIKDSTGLALGTVSNINEWLIQEGWLFPMWRPLSRMNQHRQGHYYALLLDGQALLTPAHPVFTDPAWVKGWAPPSHRSIRCESTLVGAVRTPASSASPAG